SDIDLFWHYGIDVFDSSGHRILTKAEERARPNPQNRDLQKCTRNVPIPIPPHGVLHGNFSNMGSRLSRDLRTEYDLVPGKYVIVASELGANERQIERTLLNPPNGLRIEVTKP